MKVNGVIDPLPGRSFALGLLVAILTAGISTGQTLPKPKRVLVLMQVAVSRPAPIAILQAMQRTSQATMPAQVEFLAEYAGDDLSELNWLVPKYKGTKLDLIVAMSRHPQVVAMEYRKRYAPTTPLLSVTNPSDLRTITPRGPGTARIETDLRLFEAIRTAVKILPQTRSLAFVGGSTDDDRKTNQAWMAKTRELWPQINPIDLTNLSLVELKRRVADLPAHTICFLVNFDADADGYSLSKSALAAALAPHANAPMFDPIDVSFGSGTVGGWMASMDLIGADIGKAMVRILQGEDPDTMPIIRSVPGSYRFDSRNLKRWAIDTKLLPQGSSVEFVEATFWERYRGWLLFSMGVGVTLAGFVLVLFISRERSFADLRERSRFEAILGQTVLSLNKSASEGWGDSIQEMLQSLREHIHADVTALTAIHRSGDQTIRQGFTSPETLPGPDPARCPYIAQELYAGRAVRIAKLEDFPRTATVDRASMVEFGFHSCIGVPLIVDGVFAGAFFAANYAPREWSETLVERIRQVGESVVAAWGYNLAAGESLSQSILNSFEGYVVAVDRKGLVLKTKGKLPELQSVEPGVPYRQVWNSVPLAAIATVEENLLPVLRGERTAMEVQVRYELAGAERWMQVQMQQLQHPLGGAVVTHLDVTERKRLELAAAYQMNQIAHWNRVSAVGELAASLAHEVNQPLSAILANAEVVKVLLEKQNPNMPELKEIVADLQHDGERAAAVISGMRSLLKKNPAVKACSALDVAQVIRETVRLINGDATRRNVRVKIDLCPGTGFASIDRTQLQQVLLNLMNNALEAAESSDSRWIAVRSFARQNSVLVEVEDSGPGIAAEDRERIFEAFFTTKSEGLGVGLSISRSILTAAGGSVTALQSTGGAGAIFRVSLPSA